MVKEKSKAKRRPVKGPTQTRTNIDPHKLYVSIRDKPLRATRKYLKTAKQPEACFQCFASEGLPDKVRLQIFHDPGCVTRHFDAIHLIEEPLKCNWCEVALLHQMEFQRHAFDVHRVRSRRRCSNPTQEVQGKD
ncbi:C2H2 finger domain protein [Penicillium malachiteum]|nr:C2H2 finger domain protein [Penicillium malachiteum]